MAGPRSPWGTTWLLLVFMLVNFADKAVLGLAGPDLMRDLDISRQQFGTAQSAFFALFSLAALGVSYLTRTVRTTVLLLAMALLWSAAQLPMLWAGAGFATLVATRLLLGAAEGPAAPVAVHHVYGWFAQRDRTLPTAILMAGAAAGVAVAAPTLSLVIEWWGWRWAFGAVGLIGLVWAAVWWRYGTEGPLAPEAGTAAEDGVGGADGTQPELPLRRILASGTFLSACVATFAAYWLMSAKLTWAPDYLETVMGWSGRQAGLAVGAVALTNGAALLLHGLLAQRSATRDGRAAPRVRQGAGAGLLMLGSAAAVALFALSDTPWLTTVLMFGPLSLAMVMMTVGATACARITPPSQRGIVLGALTAVFALGGVLAPAVLGRIVDAAPSADTGYRNGWLLTAALLAVGGALATAFLRPQRDAVRLGVPEHDLGRAPVAH
ncbi:MFS transporter [Streptomyces sp. A7024]|uniref:MFS transporter n=1 Tax=Streptomyces coryli TaxID=1128680 RepID=A0A6G4U0Q1_9ACTN|nr:MFS transporter [Streptomyces coryli]NGN65572.1 MFS transporter [Streptomyces coryli]